MADADKPPTPGGKLESLTAEQIEHLATVRDHWQHVRLAVGPADRDRAEAGVAEAYRAAGLQGSTRFVWSGSSQAGEISADLLQRKATRSLPGHSDRGKAAGRLVTEVVATSVLEQVWDQMVESVGREVRLSVLQHVTRRIDGSNDLGAHLWGFVRWFRRGPGSFDGYDLDGIVGDYVSRPLGGLCQPNSWSGAQSCVRHGTRNTFQCGARPTRHQRATGRPGIVVVRRARRTRRVGHRASSRAYRGRGIIRLVVAL